MKFTELETYISDSSVVVADKEQIFSDIGGEAVILHLKTGIYHGLNEIGARIWTLIQEPKAVKDIKYILLEEYEVETERCDRDLIALLNDLLAAGLIEVKNETNA
ncbi:thymidylate synthase [Nostoc minutum NIES-26]|uniref:Thymidylate synthase n=1 Tax=Nostoc minutum NIES-26 TaxID=1844469 RepID=A0A367QQC0_9NOSO|nr:PqqD family peptide modification chaperone [Dendronalium sp. ChiSLP03b]MDZ8202837.1 PqqD family peptide modification chaperone [Dendronalium sp. ChiSLP03b]RCJ25503.1 thymidylate synthase [Nostoc minutum NIES-26]